MASEGSYEGSEGTPDFAVKSKDNDENWNSKLVVEVGFSEAYEHLKESAKLWLEGTSSVSICLLIDVQENPAYRNPLKPLSDEVVEQLQLPEWKLVQLRYFVLPPNSYGPVSFRGFNWTGEVTSARMEVWRKNVQGNACLSGPATVRLPLLTGSLSDYVFGLILLLGNS